MDIAYVQHGSWGGPYQTVMADGVLVEDSVPVNPYAMGYGPKIPTQYKVLYQGYWRRVYSACYSNSGTLYIIIRGTDTTVNLCLD